MSNNIIKVKSVANNIEADLIINLLHNNNIPCLKKSKEAGDYMNIYMGYSIYGEDIYVNEDDYQAAMELINSLSNEEELINEEELLKEEELLNDEGDNIGFHIAFYKNPRMIARIIILALLGVMIVTTIVNLV